MTRIQRGGSGAVLLLAGALAAFAVDGPVGLDAMMLDPLATLRTDVRTYQASSHDRTGDNADSGNFLQTISAEKVLMDVKGPGCVCRMWMTGIDLSATLRVYFDGSATPTINTTLGNFYAGSVTPYLAPLVVDDNVSSGGFISYLPLPFRTGCRVTTTSTGHYYNITYQMYADADGVTTYTGTENSAAIRNAWTNYGHDPKTDTGAAVVTGTATIPVGGSLTLADLALSGTIRGLELTLPGMDAQILPPVTDDGRAHKGYSQFVLALDANNAGVNLIRRLDYGIGNQRATVYVDGASVGQWYSANSQPNAFLDSTFSMPATYTAGKTSITVKCLFVSSDNDWNEFHYWADSLVGGVTVRTDELNVGNTTSEAAHSYVITTATWAGSRTYSIYTPVAPANTDILKHARLRMTWDGAATPQVDVPLGGLFGSLQGPRAVRGFPTGMEGARMYCWLPMPFGSRAVLTLRNDSSAPITDLTYTVRYTAGAPAGFAGQGHFFARYRAETPAVVGRDFTMLDETGAGLFVGVVHTSTGPDIYYLEGDERIYVDGSLTPQLYGTGTEDFYNAGWYFNRGRFTRPTHGNPTMEGSPTSTDMYRFLISDAIPFTTSIKVGIEHGATNDTTNTNMECVALYYKRDAPLATLTDVFDVGDAASETAHAYATSGGGGVLVLTASYEGDDDTINLTDNGRSVSGYSEFTVALDPFNAGVLLRRRLDYRWLRQEATVTVDGVAAGTWYDAGSNLTHRYRDSEFLVPPVLTVGKSSITVRLTKVAGTPSNWTEYAYWVYALQPARVLPPCGDANCDGLVNNGDIDAFVLALTDPAAWQQLYGCDPTVADTNGDGLVNNGDIDSFVAVLLAGGCP